jgi:acetyl-CoA carboxylase carboxyltransferase component
MGAPGAVQILHRRVESDERRQLEDAYSEKYLTPWPASERGFVDAVIDPAETRAVLTSSLAVLASKRELLIGRKHDNGPQ